MTFLAADPLVIGGAAIAIGLLAFLVVIGRRGAGRNEGFLEWDPVARTAWRHDQESVDTAEMLNLHNADRVRRGLEPVTLDEYIEAVRRAPRDA